MSMASATSYRVESSTAEHPDEASWVPFNAGMELEREEALELCRQLANTPGSQAHWRCCDASGRWILRLSKGGRS